MQQAPNLKKPLTKAEYEGFSITFDQNVKKRCEYGIYIPTLKWRENTNITIHLTLNLTAHT